MSDLADLKRRATTALVAFMEYSNSQCEAYERRVQGLTARVADLEQQLAAKDEQIARMWDSRILSERVP